MSSVDSNPGNKNKFVITSSTAVLLSKLCVDYGTWVWVGCVLWFFVFFFLSFYNFGCFCCLALGYFTMIKCSLVVNEELATVRKFPFFFF